MAGFIDSILGFFGKKEKSPLPRNSLTITEKPSIEISQNQENSNIRSIDRVAVSKSNTDSILLNDEYRSISIHGHSVYAPVTYPSSTTSGMAWVGIGQSISVQGFTIHSPLTYWSENNYPEASCIAILLKAEKQDKESLTPLPYWPQYSGLTPTQRGKYLSWMSHGRNDDLDEIGYAFIFFYGLERRAIVDKQDVATILIEVQRLLLRYSASSSFNSYLQRFTAYLVGLCLKEMTDKEIKKIFPSFDNLDESSAKVILSWHWSNNLPVPWELCYSLARSSADFTKTNIVKKSPVLLKQIFRKKFLVQFMEGIQISPDYDHFLLNYTPASPTLPRTSGYSRGSNLIELLTLPIPPLDSQPYEMLKKIWSECIDELKPAISKLDKTEGKITKEVYSALPDALKDEISHPELKSWRNFISTRQLTAGLIVLQVSDISYQIGIEKRNSLTLSQSRTVTSSVRDFGWVIVPDQTISGTSYKWDDTVAIIPISYKGKTLSENFQSAALIFEMAYGIAASDENVSEIEVSFLHNFISEQFTLNPFEIECLKGLRKVLEIQPPSLLKIGKRLSNYLIPEQKIALANFLGDIVLLDSKFVKEEQKALKTVFKALDIDPVVSEDLIKKLLIGQTPDEPVTVIKPGKLKKGEAIQRYEITPEFSINKEKLKQTLEDTRAVQNILASVFEQELEEIIVNPEPEITIPEPSVGEKAIPTNLDLPFPPETLPSLDIKYISMLHDIMKMAELSQDDFTGLARKHSLMPRAAFDDINAWADEELGDFLLEESESRIIVNYKK